MQLRPNYLCLHRNSPKDLSSLPFAKNSSPRNKYFAVISKVSCVEQASAHT